MADLKPTPGFEPKQAVETLEKPTAGFEPLTTNYYGLDISAKSEKNKSLWQHVSQNFAGGKANMVRSSYGRAAMWGEMPLQEALSKGNREYMTQMDAIGEIEDVSFQEHPVRYILGEVANTLPFTLGAAKEGIAKQ